MFIDIAKIELRAGKGGDGCVSFRREKYEPDGGPYGGDGGDGGSIIFISDESVRTLMDFRYKKHYFAENGENGRTKRQYGKKGSDLIVKVPVGTLIKDFETNRVIHDFKVKDDEFTVAKGGRGGKGNARFATSTRQAPRFAQPGTKGEERIIKLELKLIADVGLVGLPNVGKSSLLSVLSDAKPKIANYHFTTLEPNLGVCRVEEHKSFVIADIPGLIEGASEGVGLGFEFLKHVERTRLLVHVLDVSGVEGRDPIEDYNTIYKELELYNENIKSKTEIIVANKTDLLTSDENLKKVREYFKDKIVLEISAVTQMGIKELKYKIFEELSKIEIEYETFDEEYEYVEESEKDAYEIYAEDGTFYIEGPLVDYLVYITNFEDYDSLKYFQKVLIDKGIIDALKEKGVKEGQSIMIGEMEFEFFE
ncbi:MAG: GTPase ObgE [Peptoniphilaceae bacterium]|uniref:GTPase ObgE n=1 Tax=Parvimonas sp. TaxID=1944660 RepID=UPI0025DFA913|nr:GTPase ObgE [Parvimonas sp.]MCI5997702.1 GTPase ObgE [Parvimonas sp.]MDD7765556.1 GTPase ObgE [Peptoniphilaceae bacterium]MDY3051097.1 GTPase ObgE [Parvimonas sp.]